MISDLFYFLIAIAGVVFLWALGELILSYSVGSKPLSDGVAKLEEGSSAEDAFPGPGALQKRAAAAARKAQQPRLAVRFQLDREVEAITVELAARLSRPRALSGLLIILGLLITLTNLRSAVGEMKSALKPQPSAFSAKQPAGTATPVPGNATDTVRKGIEGVAAAAGSAFLYSLFAIGGAAIILFFSVLAQRSATSAIDAFSTWLLEKNEKVLLEQADQPQDTSGKLALAAETLARVAATFENTNTVLADLKHFGENLENAAQGLNKAVANLPLQIDASMVKISSDVAQGISSGLEHQGEYLKALVAIYSDHALAVKETINFVARITVANENASASLARLQTLPEEIRGVGATVSTTRVATQELAAAVQSLQRKVDTLPAEDLSTAANRLSNAAEHLSKAESEIGSLLSNFTALAQSAADGAARRTVEMIGQHLECLGSALQAIKLDLSVDATERAKGLSAENAKHTAELRSALHDLKLAFGNLGSSNGRGTAELERQIEKLSQNVSRLPSVQLMKLFSAKRDTEKS